MPRAGSSSLSIHVRRLLTAVIIAAATAPLLHGQNPVPGRNVNMVSGDKWPDGDPYLQRQNEPSLAASTRNPLHLLAGSNDYRTVDLPGLADSEETGDAWLGLYKSFDGGLRWQSTLLPGYPQDTSTVGKASPLYGYQAGADPVVRAGTNGLLYFSGIVFDRTDNGKSRVFVARFIDNNNKEAGDPIHYLGATAVASNTGSTGDLLDKPWIAVDIPRGSATCNINTPGPQGGTLTQRVPAGSVYAAYSIITTTKNPDGTIASLTGKIMFTRSLDCGVTWTAPIQVSDPADQVNQGATIAIDPRNGAIQLAWRRLGVGTQYDAIMTARAIPGALFEKPRILRQNYAGRELGQLIKSMVTNRRSTPSAETPSDASEGNIRGFDQATTETSFRTNSYPTMAIDHLGRVYVAWSERGFRATGNGAGPLDSSIVMVTAPDGTGWTTPFGVDLHTDPGHQIMPSLTFAGGRLMLAYYDLREDISGLFQEFVDELPVKALGLKRHTIDLRVAQGVPGATPTFGVLGDRSVRVSEYLVGSLPNSKIVQQLQFNPPNLPLFQLGNVPFMGDYIDIAPAPAFIQNPNGTWTFNTDPANEPVFHTSWTDNRDVRPPPDGNWENYTPPTGTRINSVFDPTKTVEPCAPGRAGMRNQNVYTSRITTGLVAGSPGNSKPLSTTLPRSFVVFAQNTTDSLKWFRMTIASQPVGGRASFSQLEDDPLLLSVDVAVPARSTVSKSVFVTSSDPHAKVPVSVQQIASLGAENPLPNGLKATVVLNPDISNPDISNPDISNPDISNPDISNSEVHNPDISNPDISNPDISNPDISNPDISNPDISNVLILNPDISNPDISNPDISNPDISNPDISNPDISNPDISNGSITDYTWTVTNQGNTTSNYDVNLFGQTSVPTGIKTQVIIHKTYTTPVSDGCTLKYQLHTVLVTNVVNPQLLPDGTVDLTLWLEPGGQGRITLRVIDPDPTDEVTFNPVSAETPVTPTVTSTSVNTEDLNDPVPTPPSTTPPTATETATALSINTQPANAVVSASLGSVTVRLLRTVNGSPAPLANASVSAGLLTNPTGGHLDGQTTVATDANGFATFTTLSIDRAGQNYQLLFTAAAAGAVPVSSAFFTVTTAGADPTQNIFVVTTTNDSGPGSLRQAILNANSTVNGVGGTDLITFGFHLPGTYTISLVTPLPALTQPVIIDGTTQAGYNPLTGQPAIHVAGTGANQFQGLVIEGSASNSVIRGLSLTGFGTPAVPDTTAAIRVSANGVRIEGNWIGIAPNGIAAGNQIGVWISAGNPIIGGANAVATRNIISAGREGIFASGGAGAVVRGNFIGADPTGLLARPNTNLGINIQPGVNGFVIGGAIAAGGYFAPTSPANLISANLGGGISLQANGLGGPANTQVLGNVIGLATDGSDLGNNNWGILAQSASGTQIGAPGAGNVISGNGSIAPLTAGHGIVVENGAGPLPAVMPIIQSNYIGVDIAGTAARANALEGIILSAPAKIGGTGAGEGNLISGNGDPSVGGTGILLGPPAGGSLIQGNTVGLGATGLLLGNNAGITIDGTTGGVTIGGAVAGARNVISGNTFTGISIVTTSANVPQNVVVKGNYIGTNASGTVGGLGNGTFGISADSGEGHVIGGNTAADGNIIAGNGRTFEAAGVQVTGASTRRVEIRSNSIFSNNGLGIDHGAQFGISPNTAGGGTGGANDRQNFPVIAAAANSAAAMGYVSITLDSSPGTYRIQVFSNTSCDASGNGEGQTLIFEHTMVIGATNPLEEVVENAGISAGQILTATATDEEGNTSEFSACATATATNAFYWNPASGGNGHFYEYVTTPGDWNTAATAAAGRSLFGRGGHLVVVTAPAENTFVTSLWTKMGLSGMRGWMGLSDPTGTSNWEWITGEPFIPADAIWDAGEPNNIGIERWVEFYGQGVWNNNTVDTPLNLGYIVEYQFPISF